MHDLEWYEAVELLEQHIFKISTPCGFGTGFLLSVGETGELCSVATAAHVLGHAYEWGEPMRVEHYASGRGVLLREPDRAVFVDNTLDTAALCFHRDALPVPQRALRLAPEEVHLRVGNEVGWVGFPAMTPDTLCFFSGRISTYLLERNSYLVDGIAVNGVSGGPAVTIDPDGVTVIGLVSAYIPNRATGEPLPGLCLLSGVTHLQSTLESLRSFWEAKKREETPSTLPQVQTTKQADAHDA